MVSEARWTALGHEAARVVIHGQVIELTQSLLEHREPWVRLRAEATGEEKRKNVELEEAWVELVGEEDGGADPSFADRLLQRAGERLEILTANHGASAASGVS